MEIRKFEKSDTEQVAKLLHNSVKILNPQKSSEQETQAQAPVNIPREWEKSFLEKFTIVAERNRRIVGLAQLDDTGHINCFFTHPEYRRQGIGGQLYAAIEDHAYYLNVPTMYTETNTDDIPFFIKMGFKKVLKQNTIIRGEVKSTWIVENVILSNDS